MKKLRDIMRPDFLFTVQRDAMVTEAVRTMAKENVGIVIVLDGTRLVGVLSERDVVRRVVDAGRDPGRTPVMDVMTVGVIGADPDDDYQSAIRQMDDKSEELRYLREYLYQVPPDIAVRHEA